MSQSSGHHPRMPTCKGKKVNPWIRSGDRFLFFPSWSAVADRLHSRGFPVLKKMDKEAGADKAARKSRMRTSSLSEARPRSGSASGAILTPVTASLQEEAQRMRTLAATMTAKAQHKMKEFMGTPKRVQVPVQVPLSGAGELPSGPCGSAGAGTTASLAEEATRIKAQLKQFRDQAQAQALSSSGGAAQPTGSGDSPSGANGGEWQVWTNRKNRRTGEELERQDQRQEREKTPFQLPGQQQSGHRSYYTSNAARIRAKRDQNRSNRSAAAAALLDRHWYWFREQLCLTCGADHQVKDCLDIARWEEDMALLKAAFDCPADMRPWGQGLYRGSRGRGGRGGASASADAVRRPGQGARPPPPRVPPPPMVATKRTRDTTTRASSGLTPEAKKAKQFSDALKASLTLYLHEKDGSALTEDRYHSLKSSFAYYVEDMMFKNQDPQICSGRSGSRAVLKIPMVGETNLLWMRCFLNKSYLVQSEEDFNRSKDRVYMAFLGDRLEPELTGMRTDKLAYFVRFYKRHRKIEGLFDLKMAAKTLKGKAIHLVMDEKAEEIFVQGGCQIPLTGAGLVTFEERAKYVAWIRSQERKKFKPRPFHLEKGILAQSMDVGKLTVTAEDDEVDEVFRKEAKATKATGAQETARIKVYVSEVREQIREEKISLEEGKAKFLERTGKEFDLVLSRTTSGSS